MIFLLHFLFTPDIFLAPLFLKYYKITFGVIEHFFYNRESRVNVVDLDGTYLAAAAVRGRWMQL
jgi:hypothetical protein